MRAFVKFTVVVNVLGLLVFGWLLVYWMVLAPVHVAQRFTELDRAQVIDQKRLAEAFPSLASSSRYLVPKWMTEPVVGTGQSLALYGLILAGLNVVTVLILSRKLTGSTRNVNEDTRPDGDTQP